MLPDDVESGDAGFLDAVACVLKRCRLEGFELVGLNVNENVNYKHNRAPYSF
jgi:hypothetical protein